jgi:hypothetical protein
MVRTLKCSHRHMVLLTILFAFADDDYAAGMEYAPSISGQSDDNTSPAPRFDWQRNRAPPVATAAAAKSSLPDSRKQSFDSPESTGETYGALFSSDIPETTAAGAPKYTSRPAPAPAPSGRGVSFSTGQGPPMPAPRSAPAPPVAPTPAPAPSRLYERDVQSSDVSRRPSDASRSGNPMNIQASASSSVMTPSQLQTSHTQLVAKVRQQAQELTESTLQLHNANV